MKKNYLVSYITEDGLCVEVTNKKGVKELKELGLEDFNYFDLRAGDGVIVVDDTRRKVSNG